MSCFFPSSTPRPLKVTATGINPSPTFYAQSGQSSLVPKLERQKFQREQINQVASCPPQIRTSRKDDDDALDAKVGMLVNHHFQLVDVPREEYDPRQCQKSFLEMKFVVERKIHTDKFSEVKKVTKRKDQKEYAIKTLFFYSESTQVLKTDRLREARFCLEVDDVNLVKTNLVWQQGKTFYLLMEYCVSNLYAVGERPDAATFSEEIIWDLFSDMLHALRYLHGNRCIHLDIKPSNILLSSTGVWKLCDFGMMRQINNKKDRSSCHEGDTLYSAKENMASEYGYHSDVFSLGLTMTEIAFAVDAPKPLTKMYQVVRNDYRWIRKYLNWQRRSSVLIEILESMFKEYKTRATVVDICAHDKLKEVMPRRRAECLSGESRRRLQPILAEAVEKDRAESEEFRKFFARFRTTVDLNGSYLSNQEQKLPVSGCSSQRRRREVSPQNGDSSLSPYVSSSDAEGGSGEEMESRAGESSGSRTASISENGVASTRGNRQRNLLLAFDLVAQMPCQASPKQEENGAAVACSAEMEYVDHGTVSGSTMNDTIGHDSEVEAEAEADMETA